MSVSTNFNLRPHPVTCYLDESATDGGTPSAIVGGLILNDSDNVMLNRQWEPLLKELERVNASGSSASWNPTLHMKDFALHGRFKDMPSGQKAEIFKYVVDVIQEYKIYSLATEIKHADYLSGLSEKSRYGHSIYELCFIVCALGNGSLAHHNGYNEEIPFIVDAGNQYAEHVRLAHREMQKLSTVRGFPQNIGSLTFNDDVQLPGLQAADVICWAARRKAVGAKFPDDLSPLENMINNEASHLAAHIDKATLSRLDQYFSGARTQ